MPDAKITELPAGTVAGDCLLPLVCDPGSNPTTKQATIAALLDFAFDAFFPVGSVVIRDAAPARGTWEAFATGRVMVGLDAGDSDFDTLGETGGAKTVTLTEAEIPSHTHVQDAHGHAVTDPGHSHLTQRYPTATGGSSGFTIDTSMSGTPANNTLPTASATTGLTVNNATATNQNTGGGQAHSNLQPYIVVKAWRRTA